MFKNLIGNKVTQREIRNWLDNNGYYGSSAKFQETELHAIKRPGWLQVFRFTVTAKSVDDQWQELFGVLRDDERYRKQDVAVFQSEDARATTLSDWSEGMIVKRKRQKKAKPE